MPTHNFGSKHLYVKCVSGEILEYERLEIRGMIMSLKEGEQMYHDADNIPKWLMVRMMKLTGSHEFNTGIVAAAIATMENMLKHKFMLKFTEDGFDFVSPAAVENRKRMLEGLYNILSGAALEEFMSDDGDFTRHIEGDQDAPSKDEILLEIERIFKPIL